MNLFDHISHYLQLINSQIPLIIQISVFVLLSLKCYNFRSLNIILILVMIDLLELFMFNGILNCMFACSTFMQYTRCIIIMTSFN